MARKEFNKKVFAGKLVVIIFLGILLGISCLFSSSIEKALGIGYKDSGYSSIEEIKDSNLTLHYMDVGQGDATFISLPDGTNMLIDAGTSSAGKHVVAYIESLGVTQIDYFILTHSDSDHAGGAKRVFDAFEIKNVYRPFQISIDKSGNPTKYEMLGDYYEAGNNCNIVSTATYEKFITAAYTEQYIDGGVQKDAQVYVSYDGLKITSSLAGENFTFEFFAPLLREDAQPFSSETKTIGYPTKFYGKDSSESKNNSSPVILFEYNQSSFVFTGDLNTPVEDEVVDSLSVEEKARFNDVDVFSAGHHGSSGSNGEKLLNLMKANYIVASLGKDNSYEHPHQEFIERINAYQHDVNDYFLRTDELGDITFGFNASNELVYAANKSGYGETILWWQIALGLFVVISFVIITVKVTKNKQATAKRAVSKVRQVSKLYKK